MPATILIVGYHAYDELDACLRSIETYAPDVPVVLVDHDADETRGRAVAAGHARVRYIPRRENPGFAAGVNRAEREAANGPLLLVNPDCRLAGAIQPLIAVLQDHPRAGIVGGLVREADGRAQASARRFPEASTFVGGRTSWLTRVWPGNPLSARNLERIPESGLAQVDWVSGAFTLIRREAFDAVGGFDERFFLYWENADFCRRARDAGWTTLYSTAAEAVHLTGRASRHAPARSLIAFHRSVFRYYWKHASALSRLAAPIVAAALAFRLIVRLISARQ